MLKGFLTLIFLAIAGISLHSQTAEVAAPPPDSPEAAQVRQTELKWANAYVAKDQFALDLALSPQYVDISSSGEVTTKNQQISRLFTQTGGADSYTQKITSIRVMGDLAISQGTYVIKKRTAGSQDQEERGIFTHVFQRVRDSWQCINGQQTAILERTVARPEEKKGGLTSKMPFRHKSGNSSSGSESGSTTIDQTTPTPSTTPAPTPDPAK